MAHRLQQRQTSEAKFAATNNAEVQVHSWHVLTIPFSAAVGLSTNRRW